MSENEGVLGDGSSLPMGVVTLPKRQSSQVEHIELNGSSIVTLESAPHHYVSVSSSISQDNLNLENVLVSGSRISSHVTGATATLHHVGSSHNYSSIEYVPSSSVVSLQDDNQNKFAEGIVPVSNVNFVEMNEASMKGNSGTPLELYFDVMPTTSANSQISQASSYLPRHEHQTPKAQLLVRAYTDFIQPQEQQQQQQQQHINDNLHRNEQEQESEHPESILPDVLEANFVQLEQAVIPHNLNEYRKPAKMEPQKRLLHMQIQQKQIQNFSNDSLDDQHSNSLDEKLLLEQQSLQSHQESLHSQQPQAQNHLKDDTTFQNIQQPRYLIHKQFSQTQRQLGVSDYVVKEEVLQQGMLYTNHHGKNFQNNLMASSKQLSVENELPKVSASKLQNEHIQLEDGRWRLLPLVSRSGRPIRRRPEYIEYVNQNIKEEQIQYAKNTQYIKIESNVIQAFDEDEDILGEEDNYMISNDEDQDPSGTYSSDGKKSLPHKKRIPKKLKNSKKHVKCFKCDQCGEQCVNQSQYNQHKQMDCKNKLLLTQHKEDSDQSPSKSKQFNCEICTKGFDSQLKFFEHLKSHYEPSKKHKCEVCGGEFGTSELLQDHSVVHSREHFKCNICYKTFRKESMLELHIKVVHLQEEANNDVTKPYPCTGCPKSYRTQLALDAHIQTDHVDNPSEFTCDDCYQVFKSKAKLLSHRKAEHKEEVNHTKGTQKKKVRIGKSLKGGYPCNLCPRTFTHKNSLIYHIRGHTGERPHQCDQCGKAFFAASALKVHLRLHSGEKPYKCEMCGKFFRQWGDLRYHTSSVHSDARQFQCEFCGKDFKRKYCLVVHRRIHTGEKKYKCEYCQKCFRASSYLQNHKRIHTGERPYPCPDCGKPFRVRSDMKRHRNTHMREAGNSNNSNNNNNNNNNNNTSSTSTSSASHVYINSSMSNSQNSNSNSSSGSNQPSPLITSQPHTIIARNSHPQGQVQILQGPVSSGQLGQLIIAEGVPTVLGDQNQPIRIMVSGLNQQSNSHNIQPPPAHSHSQVATVSMSTSITPGSPNGASNLTTSSSNLTPEVIIMDESSSQPINLNILPRMIAHSTATNSHTNNEEEEYQFIPSTRNSIEMREEGDVCVWSGVHVFTG